MEEVIAVKSIPAGDDSVIWYCPVPGDINMFPVEISGSIPEKSCQRRKCEIMAVHYLLSVCIGYKGKINYSNDGKPFLPGFKKHISISHSEDIAVVMSSPVSCGVDVEKISARAGKVINKFLNESEKVVPEGFGKELYYTLMWSAKESLFKITGKPDYLKHMRTVVVPSANSNRFVMEALTGEFVREFSVFYTTFEGNVLTWAYER